MNKALVDLTRGAPDPLLEDTPVLRSGDDIPTRRLEVTQWQEADRIRFQLDRSLGESSREGTEVDEDGGGLSTAVLLGGEPEQQVLECADLRPPTQTHPCPFSRRETSDLQSRES